MRELKKSPIVLCFFALVFLLAAKEASAFSSWSFLTEREWAPEVFGFQDLPEAGGAESFFIGAERRWNGRFSGFVGLGVSGYDLSGFSESRTTLAGFAFDATPGVSLYLEFEQKKLEDGFGEADDRVVTFRTVITF